jgi:hypothetical protein
MSTTLLIIIGLSVLALIIAAILAAGERGPRVTTIERRTETEEKEGDDA